MLILFFGKGWTAGPLTQQQDWQLESSVTGNYIVNDDAQLVLETLTLAAPSEPDFAASGIDLEEQIIETENITEQPVEELPPIEPEPPVNNFTINETEPINFTINETIENISVNDTTPPTYSEFGVSDAHPEEGDVIEFYAFWHDDFGLDEWVFSWNAFGTWQNETYSFVSSYDDQTQILTKKGWIYLKDLDYDDEVATLYDQEIAWEKPLKIISLPYDNGIYRIDGKIDLYVTPGHKIYGRIDNVVSYAQNRLKDLIHGRFNFVFLIK